MLNLEFHNNTIIQGFISFDVLNHNRNHVELYGTNGSIVIPDPNMFGGPVITSRELGSDWLEHSVESKPLGKTNILNKTVRSNEAPKQSNYRGIGLSEMVDAIENKREQRCNGELALHVLDIIESTMIAAKNKTEVNMRSSCNKPSPLKDGEIQKLLK